MVDRIVPATKPEDIDRLTALTGVTDLSPVMHEPFRQWVVEDDFVDGARPDLGAVGVQLVDDVTPFELMKLRCLNGTHSSLAYTGYLAGHETIAETVADPVFAAFVRHLWREEIIPTLAPPKARTSTPTPTPLFQRYANPAIRHRTWQIAMDGCQKLPQRILGTHRRQPRRRAPLSRPHPRRRRLDALRRRRGRTWRARSTSTIRSPRRLKALSDAAATPAAKVAALLGVAEVFPQPLAADAGFRADLTAAAETLRGRGRPRRRLPHRMSHAPGG